MYTPLVPVVMFGWIFVTIILFFIFTPQRAVIISVVGGLLFLPMATYSFPIIPDYTKSTAIAYGLIFGGLLSGVSGKYRFKMTLLDVGMLLWCFAVPVLTSLSNSLGLYDGIAGIVQRYLTWGAFFWAGRRYFTAPASLRELTLGIVIGGMLYFPLILFEVRMSPQLSNIVYGFFPHSFLQHVRYGSYRPIVFMQHGLMVSLWMAVSATCAYWFWRTGRVKRVMGIPISVVSICLIIGAVLCKSANGWIYLSMGVLSLHYYRHFRSVTTFRLLLVLVGGYIIVRLSGIITYEFVQRTASLVFDSERVSSLAIRLRQEDLFGQRALLRPLFGWGGYGRGWPVDPETGQRLIRMVDALWVIFFSSNGALGLISSFFALGIGPWKVLGHYTPRRLSGQSMANEYYIDAFVLSLANLFFLLDCLLNGMINPVYILSAGILVSYYLSITNTNTNTNTNTAIPGVVS